MNRIEKYSAIKDIADAMSTDDASPAQIEELEHLLKGNAEAQRFYFDYISIHAQLLSGPERNMEVVYSRMTEVTKITEEVVVRPQSAILATTTHENEEVVNTKAASNELPASLTPLKPLTPLTPRKNYKFWVTIFVFVVLILTIITQLMNRSTELFYAQLIEGSVSIVDKGTLEGDDFFAGEYRFEQDSIIQLRGGNKLHLAAHSIIKLFNHQEVELKRGQIKLEAKTPENILLHGMNFSLHSNGSNFSVDLTQPDPVIKSGKNTSLIPNRWQPKHFWTFDSQSDRIIDSVSSAFGIPGTGATRVTGLVGQGAFMFDNSKNAHIAFGSGGGTAPATGSFSVIDGVTIEALIRPEYSGKPSEIDHIFRKGGSDKELRVLLSFQNDINVLKHFVNPKGDFKESLSFGLYVVGYGYQELKLPLDGLEGRPTLTELKQKDFNHVAATYNVVTGLKAIYINGVQLAAVQYTPGSKVLSGGPGQGAIGNNPAATRWEKGAFSGVIDEVAFYKFALPDYILQKHFKKIQQGLNYFGIPPGVNTLPEKINIPLPEFSSIQLDPLTGLPSKLMAKVNTPN